VRVCVWYRCVNEKKNIPDWALIEYRSKAEVGWQMATTPVRVCVSVCVSARVCLYVQCIYIYIHVRTCIYMYIFIHTFVHVYVHKPVDVIHIPVLF